MCGSPDVPEGNLFIEVGGSGQQVFKPLTHLCPVSCNCGGWGGLDAGFVPADWICPKSCVCPWPFDSTVPRFGETSCTVQNLALTIGQNWTYYQVPVTVLAENPRCCELLKGYLEDTFIVLTQ